MLNGIDVSHWEGRIDWSAASKSIDFAILKCTEGANFKDDTYAFNKVGCEINHIPHGAYHFFRSNIDPMVQAELFWNTVADENLNFWCIDVESNNGGEIKTNLKILLQRIEELSGKIPWIYTGPYYWNENIGAQPWASKCPLWVANYGVPVSMLPNGWSKYGIWQYSDKGIIPGIAGGVDMDRFPGTEAELQAIFGNGDVVIPAPPPSAPPLPDKVRVLASSLNMRKTPGGALVGSVPQGTIFGITGQANDTNGKRWWKVGSSYIASWYCEEYK
jgi:lysozyme